MNAAMTTCFAMAWNCVLTQSYVIPLETLAIVAYFAIITAMKQQTIVFDHSTLIAMTAFFVMEQITVILEYTCTLKIHAIIVQHVSNDVTKTLITALTILLVQHV